MMMQRSITAALIILSCVGIADANWRAKARTGERLAEEGEYDEAIVKYLEALSANGDSTLIKFGLGNVFHAQEKFEEAGQTFQAALSSPDSLIRADALYNAGNALVGAGKYQEAVEAYKTALKHNPGQMDYLHNLELAQHLLENPPQQQSEKQKQDQDDSQQEQQDQQQEQEERQQQDQQQEEQNQQQQEQQEQQEQQAQPQPEQMSPEDAERLLNALQSDEREVQENLKKQQAGEAPRGKDW
jgi:tetratricopeptide (TPR) repeat protein